jgi:hypothetical protein
MNVNMIIGISLIVIVLYVIGVDSKRRLAVLVGIALGLVILLFFRYRFIPIPVLADESTPTTTTPISTTTSSDSGLFAPEYYDDVVTEATAVPTTEPTLPTKSALAPFFYKTAVGAKWGEALQKELETGNYPFLDINAAATIMTIESCGYEKAAGDAGEIGLFQFLPGNCSEPDPWEPQSNIRCGLAYFNGAVAAADGNLYAAAAGYNGGGMARDWFLGKITRDDYIVHLMNSGYRGGSREKAGWKAGIVELYVDLFRIYDDAAKGLLDSGRFRDLVNNRGSCQAAAAQFGLEWPIK